MTTDAQAREALERLYVHDYDFTHGPSAQCEADHATLSAVIDQMAALSDPNAVHINMLRGTIAKPSVEQIIHIYGEDVLRAALDQMAWKPIETAPHDRPILCRYMWQGLHRYMVIHRHKEGPWWVQDGTSRVVHNDAAREGSIEQAANLRPTHWKDITPPKDHTHDA